MIKWIITLYVDPLQHNWDVVLPYAIHAYNTSDIPLSRSRSRFVATSSHQHWIASVRMLWCCQLVDSFSTTPTPIVVLPTPQFADHSETTETQYVIVWAHYSRISHDYSRSLHEELPWAYIIAPCLHRRWVTAGFHNVIWQRGLMGLLGPSQFLTSPTLIWHLYLGTSSSTPMTYLMFSFPLFLALWFLGERCGCILLKVLPNLSFPLL